ncbi:tryptophan halogenase family protein [Streptomyces sp. DSM 118878]
MDHRVKEIVILGGGTAGWMSAAYLAKKLGDTVRVTVLEAPSIPRIGVGEATVPNLQRVFFDQLGLAEEEWMPECNAAYKVAVKFINWSTPGKGEAHAREIDGRPDHFHHPFGLLPEHDGLPLSHYWVYDRKRGATDKPFDQACFPGVAIMDALKAPRDHAGEPVTRYAWHFDAHLVADFLRRFATEKQDVVHVQDEMVEVRRDGRGHVTALRTKSGAVIEGDLFIDCSGFRGLLINKAMEEPFIDMSDHLLCNRAVAYALPNDDEANGVEPYTSAIAMESGWTWKIPMLGRFGTGYVYSDAFADQDRAATDFCRMWGLDPDEVGDRLNHVRFRVGRNRRAWVNNVVSVGLASCFLEPLESTGIYFITAALYHLVKHFPDQHFDAVLADRFNAEIEAMFDDTRDFIQAHFALSPRTDTPFWKANKDLRLPDGIQEKVAMYRAGLPINPPASTEGAYYDNFDVEFRNFWTNGSYYSVFAGLGLEPDHPLPALMHRPDAAGGAQYLFDRVAEEQRKLAEVLPSNHEYLLRLHGK